jgi:hypothetical protein
VVDYCSGVLIITFNPDFECQQLVTRKKPRFPAGLQKLATAFYR